MSPVKSFGYLLLMLAALVTVVRILVVFAGTTSSFWTSGGWELLMVALMVISFVYVLATGFVSRPEEPAAVAGFRDPMAVRFLLNDPGAAPFWTIVRWYVGFSWFSAGYGKIRGLEGDWLTNGTALKGFWGAVLKLNPQGQTTLTYNWWYDFLNYMNTHQWYTWFAKLIALGETAVGIALLLGIFVGIAAFFGATMNFSYMLTGVAGVNPLLFLLAFTLMGAWKVAGWFGFDRYLLLRVGTPWQPGPVVKLRAAVA